MKLTQDRKEWIIAWIISITIIGVIAGIIIGTSMWIIDNTKEITIKTKSTDQIYDEQVQSDYKSGKITCDYVSKLMVEKETYKGRHPLIYADTKSMMRTYWNANDCGFEWNWWD